MWVLIINDRLVSNDGLRILTESLRSRDGQRVYGKDKNGDRRSEVCDLQSIRRHEEVLQPMQNSSSGVQPRRQSLSRRIGYLNVPFAETLALTAQPLCGGTENWTYDLLPKATTLDKATPSSIQRGEAYSSPGWPDYRPEDGGPPTAHSYQRRSRVGGRGNTWQSLAPEKIPVPH